MLSRPSPYLLLVIAPLMWAGNFVVGRGMHELINPWALTLLRWSLAALLLAPWALPIVMREKTALWHARWPLLGLSVTGVVLFQAVLYEALRTTPALNSAVILAIMPIVIPVVAFAMFRDRLSVAQALGIAISIIGALFVVSRGDPADILGLHLRFGDLLVLACVVFWSFYSNFIKLVPKGLSPIGVLWISAVIGIVILIPVAAFKMQVRPPFAFTPDVLAGIGYVAVGPSIIAFLCWNVGVAGVGATKAGLFIHLIPVFTVVLATTLLGETLEVYHVIGAAIVALGIILVSRRPSG